MGQSVADVSDPIQDEAPAPLTNGKDVDDLLAQMAGAEIDRLLAEAEVPRESTPDDAHAERKHPSSGSVPGSAKPVLLGDHSISYVDPAAATALLNDTSEEFINPAGTRGPLGEARASDESAATSSEEKAALADAIPPLDANGSMSPAPALPPPDAVSGTTVAPGASDHSASSIETLLDERSDLAESDEPSSLPFYLKPLEWISAPFENVPAPVRDGIGKIALLTLFNAVAVMVYVVVFRKHH